MVTAGQERERGRERESDGRREGERERQRQKHRQTDRQTETGLITCYTVFCIGYMLRMFSD